MLPRWKSVSPRPTAAEWAAVVRTAGRRVADFSAARWRDWSRVRKSPELWLGLKQGVLVGAAAATLFLPPAGLARLPSSEATRFVVPAGESLVSATPAVLEAAAPRAADFQDVEPAAAVRDLANWVAASNDNRAGHQRLPFAVLDKLGARVYVFDAQAQLIGASLVLLGSASGDDTPPGVGDKKLSEILSHERITPAGRFVSEPGRDDVGNDVVWVDYDSALAMHRVQVIDPAEKRFERIATPYVHDKRISNGCINVPIAFYDAVVKPALGRTRAVVYILPEVKRFNEVFPQARARPESLHEGVKTAAL